MKVRLLSTIALLPIAIFLIAKGGSFLLLPLVVISVIGAYELYKITGVNNRLMGYAGYIITIAYYVLLEYDLKNYLNYLTLSFMFLILILYVLTYPKYCIDDVMVVFFGFFYVSIMLSYIYQVRQMNNGSWLIWLIFISAWGSDSCAYLAGYFFGKHKLAPKLSPKKTKEGAIGGVLGAALIGAIFAFAIGNKLDTTSNTIITFAIISAGGSILAQLGDLSASAIKRNKDIKDFGNLIPGHGGVLDRFDSIIFTAPAVYLLSVFFLH